MLRCFGLVPSTSAVAGILQVQTKASILPKGPKSQYGVDCRGPKYIDEEPTIVVRGPFATKSRRLHVLIWDFPEIRVPYFGVMIIRIPLFRVLY